MPDNKKKQTWTVLSMLEWATGYFEKRSVPSPRLSIEWILADLLQTGRLDLYLLYDRPLSPQELEQLRPLIKRRGKHEPLQYITGHAEFLNCRIELNPSLLIPRQETEQLVSMILDDHPATEKSTKQVIDIGTGSGCIPIALKHSRPEWHCIGIDNSREALKSAQHNADLNETEVEFIEADMLHLNDEPLTVSLRNADLIISNPPYIYPDEESSLEKEVLDYEPRAALIHSDPLLLYHAVGQFACEHLRPGGSLYLECNTRITESIAEELQAIFPSVGIRPDLDKKKRFIVAKKREQTP